MERKCERCPLNHVRKATVTKRFSVDDEDLEIHLCSKCHAAFRREIGLWQRLAHTVDREPPVPVRPVIDKDARDATRRIRAIRENATAQAREKADAVAAKSLPNGVDLNEWRVDPYVLQRIKERGFKTVDVIAAATYPTSTSHREEDGPDLWRHSRGKIHLIVNRRTRTVITVMNEFEYDESKRDAAHRKAIARPTFEYAYEGTQEGVMA